MDRGKIDTLISNLLDGESAVRDIAKLGELAASIEHDDFGTAGRSWVNRPMFEIDKDPRRPAALAFLTLRGFVDYLFAEPEATTDLLIHVASPTVVVAFSPLYGGDKHLRRTIATAQSPLPDNPIGWRFNTFDDIDKLQIILQTGFAQLGDVMALRQFLAGVRSTKEIGTADDGVSQQVQAKRGISFVQNAAVNNPWKLAPFRTFTEIEQPTSPYVLRFESAGEGLPEAGLFETGNGDWRITAIAALREWLRTETKDGWKILG